MNSKLVLDTIDSGMMASPGHQVEQAGPCNPTLCALGVVPHAHCVCGLAMPLGATLCDLCRSERLVLDEVVTDDHEDEWDGQRYPSRRVHRPADIPAARYHDLLQAIFAPDAWRETQKERRKAA